MPYTTVVAGTTITASWANANVRDQVVTPFASTAARDSAITSPVEGMVAYTSDTDTLWKRTGSAWQAVIPDVVSASVIHTEDSTNVDDNGSYVQIRTIDVTPTRDCLALIVVSGSLRSQLSVTGDFDWRSRVQVDNANHPDGGTMGEQDGYIEVPASDLLGYGAVFDAVPWPLTAGTRTIDFDFLVASASAGDVQIRASKVKVYLLEEARR